MRSYLINQNICLYYWLKKKVGRKQALRVATALEKMLLIFGREVITHAL